MLALEIIAVAVSIHLATASCVSVDQTLVPGTNGSAVVDACIAKVSAVFTDDNQLMLRYIAYVETSYGNDPDTYSDAVNHGGIWQLSRAKYDTTKNDTTLASLIESIQTQFGINWTSTQWSDLRKPFYSALAARLYLHILNMKAPIPLSFDISAQAIYWATYYTNSGGTESDYVTAINELLGQGCNVNALELFFVTDESGSVGFSNYQLIKEFVYNVTNAFEIGPDDVQVGLLSFSSSYIFRFYLNAYSTKASLLSEIKSLQYFGGGTNTAHALDAVRSSAFTEDNGARPASLGVPKVIIVITDGISNNANATAIAASGLHDDGYIVIAVGIAGANINELNAIASDPAYVSFINSFDENQLHSLQQSISQEACDSSPSFSTDDTVTTTITREQVQYLSYPFNASVGLTIQVNVTSGRIIIYVSIDDTVTKPSEVFYSAMIVSDGYADVHVSCNTSNNKVYIAISSASTSNESTVSITAENGDVSTEPVIITSDRPTFFEEVPVQVINGDTVSFNCSASGKPLPSISWYKGDVQQFKTSGHIDISNYIVNSTHIISILTISSVTNDDNEAVYTCTASNTLPDGVDMRSINFILDVNDNINKRHGFAINYKVGLIIGGSVVGALLVIVVAVFVVVRSRRKKNHDNKYEMTQKH